MELTSVWVSTSFKEYLQTLFFLVFGQKITKKCLKSTKKVENSQKSIPTTFPLHAASESWSKYTTIGVLAESGT